MTRIKLFSQGENVACSRAENGGLPQKYFPESVDLSEYESKRNTTAWKPTRLIATLFPSWESRALQPRDTRFGSQGRLGQYLRPSHLTQGV
jgi:hypothetical protein